MIIELHPKITALVAREVRRNHAVMKGYPRRVTKGWSRPTYNEIVNEILWLALRSGDISKHYTSKSKK